MIFNSYLISRDQNLDNLNFLTFPKFVNQECDWAFQFLFSRKNQVLLIPLLGYIVHLWLNCSFLLSLVFQFLNCTNLHLYLRYHEEFVFPATNSNLKYPIYDQSNSFRNNSIHHSQRCRQLAIYSFLFFFLLLKFIYYFNNFK